MMMKWNRLIGCSNILRNSSRQLSSFAGIPTDESRVTAVLGGQWGDEGKGTFLVFVNVFSRRFFIFLILERE